MKSRIIYSIFTILLAIPAHADLLADAESPVTTDAKWILLGGTGLTLATVAAHHSIFADFEKTTVDNKPLGKNSKYGDALGQLVPNVLYVGGTLAAHYLGSPMGKYRAWLMAEATVYAAVATTILKYTIREPRPYEANVRNSFPSGHATTVFAFAGVVAAEHGWYWGVPAMAMATFVGYSRINDNQHHVHDIVSGATIGLSYAYGIWYAQKPEREQLKTKVMLLPQPLPGGGELAVAWEF